MRAVIKQTLIKLRAVVIVEGDPVLIDRLVVGRGIGRVGGDGGQLLILAEALRACPPAGEGIGELRIRVSRQRSGVGRDIAVFHRPAPQLRAVPVVERDRKGQLFPLNVDRKTAVDRDRVAGVIHGFPDFVDTSSIQYYLQDLL